MAQFAAHGTACMGIVSTVMIDPARGDESTDARCAALAVFVITSRVVLRVVAAALLGLFYNGENTARIA